MVCPVHIFRAELVTSHIEPDRPLKFEYAATDDTRYCQAVWQSSRSGFNPDDGAKPVGPKTGHAADTAAASQGDPEEGEEDDDDDDDPDAPFFGSTEANFDAAFEVRSGGG